jgi:uncharacterized protein YfaS (alpha-2-macroglobulin family)
MMVRLLALLLVFIFVRGPGWAAPPDPAITGTRAEALEEIARGCIAFSKAPAGGAEDHPGDYLSFEPHARVSVQVMENRLCADGLAFGERYTVTIAAGLRFADGSVSHVAQTTHIAVPDRDPLVAVAGSGYILPRIGATGVTIQTINVPTVRIRVLRISERRLAADTAAAAGGARLRPDPAVQSFRLGDLRWNFDKASTLVWSGTMRTGGARNRTVETAFPLATIVDPSKPGAYVVLAENAAEPAAKLANEDADADEPNAYDVRIAGHWVLSTDLGLSSLAGQDGLHVTVRSLGSAAPLAGVRLELLSRAQDVLGVATTGPDGAAVFAPGLLRGKSGAAAAVLVARTDGGDMAVQDIAAPAFDLSDRGADGRVVPGPIEGFLYTDRGIYRPGETVQVMALLRSHGLVAVDGVGLTLVLRRPDGVEASRTTLPPQPAAGFHQAIGLSRTAAQGDWTIEAMVDPTLPPIGRAIVSVQDFVPQQLAVTLTGPAAVTDGTLRATLDGRFLYGAPAAGLPAEGELRLVRDEHPLPSESAYAFGIADETIPDSVQTLTLPDADAAGHVALEVPVAPPPGVASPLRAEVEAGLTEPGGRAVKEKLSFAVHNHPRLIGVRKLFDGDAEEGQPAGFVVRAFAPEGALVPATGLTWRLVQEVRHWDWWRDHDNGDAWTYHFHTVDSPVADGTLDVAADQPAQLGRTLDWGDYRLIVTDPAGGAATSIRFSVGWSSPGVAADIPDRLEVSADRSTLAPGQTANLRLRGPFAGSAQLVVESGGRVLESRALDLPAGGTTVEVTAGEEWGPGAHVLVTAYRPLTAPARAHDPVRAVGLAWIGMDAAPHTLGVAIGGPRQVTPRQTVAVPIHVTGAHGAAFVTLAAVDEGILHLTRFASPDPVATLFGRTRFGLDMRDDYGRLLEGHADTGALHEGGDGGDIGGEGLPVTTTRVVALFQGPVALDANGDATVALDVPDFAGELRLMAVAYDHDAAGHAEAALTVRDPVVADVALPRFLAPDDVAEIAVSLDDTDGPAGDYHVALAAQGEVALRGPATVQTHLDRGERRTTHFRLAGAGIGIGHLQAVLTGPSGLRIAHDWDIAVRSPHPELVLSRTESQGAGESWALPKVPPAAFLPGSVQVTIGYSSLAGLDVPALLRSLYTYPYGCTEQLSSSAFPLLYYGDARLLGQAADAAGVRARVQQAIATLGDRQDSSGRFGLWRVGDDQASVWLNVYALDFLLHAREAGFDVPDRVTASAASWVDRQLRSAPDENAEAGAYAQPAAPTQAYAAYVLARTGRVDPARLRLLGQDLQAAASGLVSWRSADVAAPLALAQLAGAKSLMGDADGADETFQMAVGALSVKDVPAWWRYGTFWSPLRDYAGVLAIAAETGHMDVAARLLDRARDAVVGPELARSPEHMNTQEKAWLLVAAHALSKQDAHRSLSIDGAEPQKVPLPYAVTLSGDSVAHGITVRNADPQPLFRTVTVRGAPAQAPPAVSAGLTLHRAAFTLQGKAMDTKALRQTDRFVVVLSGAVEGPELRRLVLSDPLPAGLEIEAAVVKQDAYPFLGELTHLLAHEQRDDRFVAAFDAGDGARFREVDDKVPNPLEPREFRVAYLVRAVTPGTFIRPEAVAQDMYRPEVMARTDAGKMEVAPH